LGISEHGTVLIESKVDPVFAENLNVSRDRRIKRIVNAIEKAINQLGGAARNLRRKAPVYRATGEPIAIDDDSTRLLHGIALLSDMHVGIDWEDIATRIVNATKKHNMIFHVFDLTELRMIVGFGERPEVLSEVLIKRFIEMAKAKTAMVRVRLPRKLGPKKQQAKNAP
jgi:hypothetical protein